MDTVTIFNNKKSRSVCLSGYTFRHALTSHAEILDSDQGHIFRKHRHKNNKKSHFYLRENGKIPAVTRVFASRLLWGAYIYSEILSMRYVYARYNCGQLTRKALRAKGSARTARSLTLHDVGKMTRLTVGETDADWERAGRESRERERVEISWGTQFV